MVKVAYLGAVFVFLSCLIATADQSKQRPKVTFDFKSGLYESKVLGNLSPIGKGTVYILSGRECMDCDGETNLYVTKSTDGPIKLNAMEARRFLMPGKYSPYDAPEKIISNTRVFFGNCLEKKRDIVLWVGTEYIWWDKQGKEESGRREIKYFVSPFENYTIQPLKDLSLEYTESMVKKKTCFEISGLDRLSSP